MASIAPPPLAETGLAPKASTEAFLAAQEPFDQITCVRTVHVTLATAISTQAVALPTQHALSAYTHAGVWQFAQSWKGHVACNTILPWCLMLHRLQRVAWDCNAPPMLDKVMGMYHHPSARLAASTERWALCPPGSLQLHTCTGIAHSQTDMAADMQAWWVLLARNRRQLCRMHGSNMLLFLFSGEVGSRLKGASWSGCQRELDTTWSAGAIRRGSRHAEGRRAAADPAAGLHDS